MKFKYLAIFALTTLLSSNAVNIEGDGSVYICTGPKAKAYHRTDRCSGLNRCSGDIVSVSLEKAKQMGRTPCKKCY